MTHIILIVIAFLAVTVFALAGAVNLDRWEAKRDIDFRTQEKRGGGS